MKKIGSRIAVFRGKAQKTSGGLQKTDLMKKKGKIISKKASAVATKKSNLKDFLIRSGKRRKRKKPKRYA